MAARSIASLTLSFGLVSIPVKLYSATESAGSVKFNLLAKDGSRLKQQYVSEKDQQVVARADMVKGYEFEKDHFVLFTPEELKALEEGSSHAIDIVSFIPEKAVDPVYYDKAYLLAPDKRGGKPYELLREAMRQSGRCALAKWSWKAKQYVVQVRPTDDGLILQQLLYAEEVRSLKDLGIEQVTASPAELNLALQLIEQSSADAYDPTAFADEEKKRVLAAIDEKISGKQIIASAHNEEPGTGQVIDLMEALKASLGKKSSAASVSAKVSADVPLAATASKTSAPAGVNAAATAASVTSMVADKPRKAAKRAVKADDAAEAVPTPVRARARK